MNRGFVFLKSFNIYFLYIWIHMHVNHISLLTNALKVYRFKVFFFFFGIDKSITDG